MVDFEFAWTIRQSTRAQCSLRPWCEARMVDLVSRRPEWMQRQCQGAICEWECCSAARACKNNEYCREYEANAPTLHLTGVHSVRPGLLNSRSVSAVVQQQLAEFVRCSYSP